MAIQDSINSAIGSVGQVSAMVKGLKKLEESTELQKKQNEVEKLKLQGQLDSVMGEAESQYIKEQAGIKEGKPDLLNEAPDKEKALNTYGESLVKGLGEGIADTGNALGLANDYNKILQEQYKAAKKSGDLSKTNSLAGKIGSIAKSKKKMLSDLEAAQIARQSWNDKLIAMKTLRAQMNVLESKGVK